MSLSSRWKLCVAMLACATLSFGCYSETKAPAQKPAGGGAGPTAPAGGGAEGPGTGAPGSDLLSARSVLSAEDKALADAQKECPVSGEELGSMGTPVKEMVKGEPVFLCCKRCIEKLHADEDGYLAKVAELKKGQPAEGKPEEGKPEEKPKEN